MVLAGGTKMSAAATDPQMRPGHDLISLVHLDFS
jgi:hypothetical protein